MRSGTHAAVRNAAEDLHDDLERMMGFDPTKAGRGRTGPGNADVQTRSRVRLQSQVARHVVQVQHAAAVDQHGDLGTERCKRGVVRQILAQSGHQRT